MTALEVELTGRWQEKLGTITVLAGSIGADSEAGQARDLTCSCEQAAQRWRVLLTEVSERKEKEGTECRTNMNLIVDWTEDSLVLLAKSVNVSELTELKETIRVLQAAKVDFIRQQVALEELASQVGSNSPAYQVTRQKVVRIGQMLSKRLNHLIKKSDKLSRLLEGVEEGWPFVDVLTIFMFVHIL